MKKIITLIALAFTVSAAAAGVPDLWITVNEFTGSFNPELYVGSYKDSAFQSRIKVPHRETASAYHSVRDLVQDPDGTVWVFNGTFKPTLWQIKPNGEQAEKSFPGWSLVNQSSRGGIALGGEYIFLTSNSTMGTPDMAKSGCLRVNKKTMVYEYFADGLQPIDVAFHDGKVYLIDEMGRMRMYDASSLKEIARLDLPWNEYSGMTVGSDESIYTTGYIYIKGEGNPAMIRKFSSSGLLMSSLVLHSVGKVGDIDINPEGLIAIGATQKGLVVMTDESLKSYTSFKVADNEMGTTVFVAFAASPKK